MGPLSPTLTSSPPSDKDGGQLGARYGGFLDRIRRATHPWPPQKERILLEPFSYLSSTPGKDMRARMMDAFNHWLNVPHDQLVVVKRIVGQLHTASLLMDDVEDGSELRRGQPVAHKVYGVPQTLNSANYVYFLAFQELSNLKSSQVSSTSELWTVVNEELLRLHRGQGMDLYWRELLVCPTEEEYIEMVQNKTGGLFRIAIKLMRAVSLNTTVADYIPLVDLIGIIFQIRDDYLNLSSQYTQNKGFCEDLSEGKFSFLVVHAIRADSSNQRILNLLRQKPTDEQTKAYAAKYMREHTRSFAYTEKVLDCLEKQAFEEIKRLGSNQLLERILEQMHVSSGSLSSAPQA